MGGLQALSAQPVEHIASSRAIAEFVARSDVAVNYTRLAKSHNQFTVNDDVILGFWLSDAQLQQRMPNLSYVFVNDRMTNLECDPQDCARQKICSYYKVPSNSSILIHNLKSISSMVYVYAVISGWARHDMRACKRLLHGGQPRSFRPAQKWVASLHLPKELARLEPAL